MDEYLLSWLHFMLVLNWGWYFLSSSNSKFKYGDEHSKFLIMFWFLKLHLETLCPPKRVYLSQLRTYLSYEPTYLVYMPIYLGYLLNYLSYQPIYPMHLPTHLGHLPTLLPNWPCRFRTRVTLHLSNRCTCVYHFNLH